MTSCRIMKSISTENIQAILLSMRKHPFCQVAKSFKSALTSAFSSAFMISRLDALARSFLIFAFVDSVCLFETRLQESNWWVKDSTISEVSPRCSISTIELRPVPIESPGLHSRCSIHWYDECASSRGPSADHERWSCFFVRLRLTSCNSSWLRLRSSCMFSFVTISTPKMTQSDWRVDFLLAETLSLYIHPFLCKYSTMFS